MLIKIQKLKALILFITLLGFMVINLGCCSNRQPPKIVELAEEPADKRPLDTAKLAEEPADKWPINDTIALGVPPPKDRKPPTGYRRDTMSTVILDNDFEVVRYINPADQSLTYIIKISSQKKAGEMVRLLEINSIELQSNGNKVILQLDDLFRY